MPAPMRCPPISFALKRPESGVLSGKDVPNVLGSARTTSPTKTPTRQSRRPLERSRSKRRERDGRRRRRHHSRAGHSSRGRHSSSSSDRKASRKAAQGAATPHARSPEKESAMDVEPEQEAPSVTETLVEPKASAEPRVSPGLPLLSFRQFILTQPVESADGKTAEQFLEEYRAYDADHRRDCQERFWTANKEQAILVDSYHPESLRRWSQWRAHRTRQSLDNFVGSLEAGRLGSLRLGHVGASPEDGGTGQGVDEARHIILPTDKLRETFGLQKQHILIVEDVPQQVSIWDIHDQLSQLSGFEDAYVSGRDLAKTSQAAFAHFSSEKDLEAALSSLKDGLELQGVRLRVKRAEECEEGERKVLLVPSCAGSPEQLEEDFQLALQLVRALDAAVCIPDEDVEKVAAKLVSVPEVELRLDLHILYLRQVHNCCFYSGEWCTDPHELNSRAGAGSLRQASTGSVTAAVSTWMAGHRERIRGLIARAAEAAKPPPVKPSAGEEPMKSQWLQACQELTKKEADDRFRCTRCTKLFRGVSFVQKHIFKLHPEVTKKLEDDIMEEQMKEAFFRDPQAAHQAQAAIIRSG